jgi:hypothetical protein
MAHSGFMPDRYGIPDNMFGSVPEDFYALVGRVALVSTMVEDRVLGLLWALDDQDQPTYAGLPASQLSEEVTKRLDALEPALGLEIRRLLSRVSAALDRRHALVHSLWPNPQEHRAQGWRSRRLPKSLGGGSEIVWTLTSVATLEDDLRELVHLADVTLRAMNAVWAARGRPW